MKIRKKTTNQILCPIKSGIPIDNRAQLGCPDMMIAASLLIQYIRHRRKITDQEAQRRIVQVTDQVPLKGARCFSIHLRLQPRFHLDGRGLLAVAFQET